MRTSTTGMVGLVSRAASFVHPVNTRCLRVGRLLWSVPSEVLDAVLSETSRCRVGQDLQRMKPHASLTANCSQEAAVFVPLCRVNSKPSVLFTVRSANLMKHRGEVSFPGGKRDPSDVDLVHTALREMEEELGIVSNKVDVWSTMPALPDRLGIVAITPVLGYVPDIDLASLAVNEREVASVFALSLEHLCMTTNQRYTTFKNGTMLPVFVNGPHKVWGLSAIILDWVLGLLFPDHYKTKHRTVYKK